MIMEILLCLISVLAIAKGNIQLNITNLAYKKTTSQSTTFRDSSSNTFSSSLAVDGSLTTGFSGTDMQRNQWLHIDLGQQYSIGTIELYNREGYTSRLSKISLLTSVELIPPDPSLLPGDSRAFSSPWAEQSYQEDAYGEVGIVSLQNKSLRHLVIFNSGESGITLKEVLVFPDICYNLAEVKISKQSSDLSSRIAQYGNDGFLNEFSFTEELEHQYWMVSLVASYEVYKVVIYGRTDCCQEKYSGWTILANNDNAGVNGPVYTGNPIKRAYAEAWQEVAFISGIIGEIREVKFPSVSARHVAVFNVYSSYGIYLRELQVYGCQCELPDMVSKFKMETSKNSGCVTLRWNITHPHCSSSAFKYEYLCDGEETWSSAPNIFSGHVCYPSYGKLVTCQMRVCLGSFCYFNKITASSASCECDTSDWRIATIVLGSILGFIFLASFLKELDCSSCSTSQSQDIRDSTSSRNGNVSVDISVPESVQPSQKHAEDTL